MGIIKITLKFAVVMMILWSLALIIDGKYGTLGDMGLGFINFINALPPQGQNGLSAIALIGGFFVLMKHA